ncbi:hypothetical protein MSPP1_000321 [Malassezia sp. CBS 17886]|nr:hypothetical protein MSPP1_000321 [Malassezia sp. CBS 17886]
MLPNRVAESVGVSTPLLSETRSILHADASRATGTRGPTRSPSARPLASSTPPRETVAGGGDSQDNSFLSRSPSDGGASCFDILDQSVDTSDSDNDSWYAMAHGSPGMVQRSLVDEASAARGSTQARTPLAAQYVRARSASEPPFAVGSEARADPPQREPKPACPEHGAHVGIPLRDCFATRSVEVNRVPSTESLRAAVDRTRSPTATQRVATDESESPHACIRIREGETAASLSRRIFWHTKSNADQAGHTASILAHSAEKLYVEALQLYLRRFAYHNYPLDMAMRHFLSLEVLPDAAPMVRRVIAAFSERYVECNPGILTIEQTGILVSTMLLLHTNPHSASASMSKAEYTALARPSNVPAAVIEYMYDNASLVPFVYTRTRPPAETSAGPVVRGLCPPMPAAANRQRVQHVLYQLLVSRRIFDLRCDKRQSAPLMSAFLSATCDFAWQRDRCVHAPLLEFGATPAGAARVRKNTHDVPAAGQPSMVARIICIGTVRRRDVDSERTRKSLSVRRKQWGLVVTGSALLWMKDVAATRVLQGRLRGYAAKRSCGLGLFGLGLTAPQDGDDSPVLLRVDEVVPLRDARFSVEDADHKSLCITTAQRSVHVRPEPGSGTVDTWLDLCSYLSSLCAAGLTWDDASDFAAGEYRQGHLRYGVGLPGPFPMAQTGAECDPAASFAHIPAGRKRYLTWLDLASLQEVCAAQDTVFAAQAFAEHRDTQLARTLHVVRRHYADCCRRQESWNKILAKEEREAHHLGLLIPLQRSTNQRVETARREIVNTLRKTELASAHNRALLCALEFEMMQLQTARHSGVM